MCVLYVHPHTSARLHSFHPINLFLRYRDNDKYILAENWEVYSGVVSLNSLTRPNRVRRILLSEKYNNKSNDHDVALLKLEAPVVFDGQSELSSSQISTNNTEIKGHGCAAGRSKSRTDADVIYSLLPLSLSRNHI